MDFNKIDPTFLADLKKSDEVVYLIARNLRLNGFSVTLPPINIRPDTSQMAAYQDEGDLLVSNSIIEVKQRPDLCFTSLSEFPYDTIIVDVVHHWESMSRKPSYYVICNSDLSGAIIVNGKTKDKWTVSTRWDGKRNRERTFYLIDIGMCKYWDFREVPKFRFE